MCDSKVQFVIYLFFSKNLLVQLNFERKSYIHLFYMKYTFCYLLPFNLHLIISFHNNFPHMTFFYKRIFQIRGLLNFSTIYLFINKKNYEKTTELLIHFYQSNILIPSKFNIKIQQTPNSTQLPAKKYGYITLTWALLFKQHQHWILSHFKNYSKCLWKQPTRIRRSILLRCMLLNNL